METIENIVNETLEIMDTADRQKLPRLKQRFTQVVARLADEIGLRFTYEILSGPVMAGRARIEEAILDNDYPKAVRVLDEMVAATREALTVERGPFGRLRQRTISDIVKARLSDLSEFAWAGAEKSTLIDVLKDGDEIATVDWNAITLIGGRQITRSDIRLNCRREILKSLVSDEKIRALQEDAERSANRHTGSGSGLMAEDGRCVEFGANN
jgi:hypothetical protein